MLLCFHISMNQTYFSMKSETCHLNSYYFILFLVYYIYIYVPFAYLTLSVYLLIPMFKFEIKLRLKCSDTNDYLYNHLIHFKSFRYDNK